MKKFTFHLPLSGSSSDSSGSGKLTSTLDGENKLVNDVAHQIASFLVSTQEPVEAYLAVNGSLDAADNLATSNLWTRNLEQLETMGAYPDPKLDAYRLYNIGVANEALGYEAQDRKSAIKYLQQASVDYGKAIDARPEEKGFLVPQDRIKTALAHYTDASGAPPRTNIAASSAAPPAPSAEPAAITNQDVIDMVHAHMDDSNILDNIQSAPAVNFDLSTKGQVQLTNSGVKGPILAAMKARARGVAPPASAHTAPARPR